MVLRMELNFLLAFCFFGVVSIRAFLDKVGVGRDDVSLTASSCSWRHSIELRVSDVSRCRLSGDNDATTVSPDSSPSAEVPGNSGHGPTTVIGEADVVLVQEGCSTDTVALVEAVGLLSWLVVVRDMVGVGRNFQFVCVGAFWPVFFAVLPYDRSTTTLVGFANDHMAPAPTSGEFVFDWSNRGGSFY